MFFLDEDEPNIAVDESCSVLYGTDGEHRVEDDFNNLIAMRQDSLQSMDIMYGDIAPQYAVTLPVDIPSKGLYRSNEQVDVVSLRNSSLHVDDGDDTDNKMLQSHQHGDIFRKMRLHALSIRAPDDPEILFGERPWIRNFYGDAMIRTDSVQPQRNGVVTTVVDSDR